MHSNNLPNEVRTIFRIFNIEAPDSIRLVGGCVRDLLIGIKIEDFDFATKFPPEQTIKILEKNNIKAIPTGIKYGTITALINQKTFEITTLRQDSKNNGRHPKAEFIDDYLLDAKRRDFTINALYLDENEKIFDYFDGTSDLKKQKVKFIGNANERIQEDYLRILRFLRFSLFYAKDLDEDGLKACINNRSGLKNLSSDRIRTEFMKILNKKPPSLTKLIDIIKTITKIDHEKEVFGGNLHNENLKSLLEFEKKIQLTFHQNLKFASLILSPENNINKICAKLNFSNNDRKYFTFLQSNFSNKNLKNLLCHYQKDIVRDLYLIQSTQNPDLEKIIQDLQFINKFNMPDFPINGQDLLNLGLSGAKIGKIMQETKDIWIENDFKINKEDLIKLIHNSQSTHFKP